MRRHDPYARLLLDRMLSLGGRVEQEFPIPPLATRRADLLFAPEPATKPPEAIGALGRVMAHPCLVEAYGGTVRRPAYEAAQGKRHDLHRAARSRGAPYELRVFVDAHLWLLCTDHPRDLLRAQRAQPLAGAPRGFYAVSAWPTICLVSLRRLPKSADTLMLRLLSRWRAAGALPALRRRVAQDPRLAPVLDSMVLYIKTLNPSPEGELTMLDVATEMQKWKESLQRSALRKGMKKGIEKGISLGLAPLERQFARRLGRPLSSTEQTTLLTRLQSVGPERLGDVVLDLDASALAAWLVDPAAR